MSFIWKKGLRRQSNRLAKNFNLIKNASITNLTICLPRYKSLPFDLPVGDSPTF